MGEGQPLKHREPRIDPWTDASLVTPLHAVRLLWNGAVLRKLCAASRQQLFIILAEDQIKGRLLNMKERYAVARRETTQKQQKRKDLPEEVEVAWGMKVMVTSNIQTDLDLANGARSEIIDIVLHASEPPISGDSTVQLEYLGQDVADLCNLLAWSQGGGHSTQAFHIYYANPSGPGV